MKSIVLRPAVLMLLVACSSPVENSELGDDTSSDPTQPASEKKPSEDSPSTPTSGDDDDDTSIVYDDAGNPIVVGEDGGVAPPQPDGGTVPPGGDAVLVGAGDIASCGSSGTKGTADLIKGIPGTVFTTGDNAYSDGADADFTKCYDPTWGAFKARTRPATGNHDYHTSGASGYFKYFGASAGDSKKGYYSYDLGAWHVVVLNSNCSEIGGCDSSSAQNTWLKSDLAASKAKCTVAMWHHPLYNVGHHGPSSSVAPLWQTLYDNGADLVLEGHDHNYQRWAPMDAKGKLDSAKGLRSFVVGTGGADFYALGSDSRIEAKDSNTWGVLKLTLHATSYDFEFVPMAGKSFTDKGTGNCH